MASRYPKEVHKYIAENCAGHSAAELAEMTNAACGTAFTAASMKSYKANHKLKSGTPGGTPKGKSLKWPEAVTQFIKENCTGRSRHEIATMVNETFGAGTMTAAQVSTFMGNRKIRSGLDCRFKPGVPSWSAGKKVGSHGRSVETQFKPGHRPHNAAPIGEIRHTTDGYLVRKIAEPNKWEFVHRATWEEHFGKIPPGHVVSFKDGNKDNVAPENLMLITNAENLELLRTQMRFEHAELTEVGLNLCRLKIKARKKRRREHGELS